MGGIDNRGISCLGLCHPKYNVPALVKLFQETDSIIRFGWLDKFFTPNARPSQESQAPVAIMRMNKPKICRVHIINGPGLNNNRVQRHEITHGYTNQSLEAAIIRRDEKFLSKFRDRLKVVRAIAAKAPPMTLELYISPWLEHAPIKQQTFNILVEEVIKEIPYAKIVDNPVTGPFTKVPGIRVYKEKHGDTPPADCDFVDLDGEDMETVNMRAFGERFPDAIAVMCWGLRENGNDPDKPWTQPQNRVDFPRDRERGLVKHWIKKSALEETSGIDARDIAGLVMHNPQDGAKRGFVFKLGDDRNYAVMLLPTDLFPSKPTIISIRKGGKRIDTGKVRGRYTEDGSNRWIIDFTKPVGSYPTNIVIAVDRKHGYLIKIPALNRVD